MQTPSRMLHVLRSRPGPAWRERLLAAVLCGLIAGLVALPLAVERAVEDVHFSDVIGTFPVEVSLCHDGRSTLDTGILGKVFWDQTGALGFGAYARATGPPEAGGTLASYVDPAFFQANVAFIRDPDTVVAAYSSEMRSALWRHVLGEEAVAVVLGGAILFLVLPRRRLRGVRRRHAALAGVLVVGVATGLSAGAGAAMFSAWDCSSETGQTFAARDMTNPTFSSPQMSEVVSQVRPFIEKNTRRIDAAADQYEATAAASLASLVPQRAAAIAPRDGETMVLAEADPQGSFVGVHVRTTLYADLVDALGKDAISLRTISGDVTSNGTVAESAYIKAEAKVAPDVPVAAVGGDHDSVKTWKQMKDAGFTVPDLTTSDVNGLEVTGANDREHKTLFGGSITNPTGVSEEELGQRLRDKVGDKTGVVLMHQPSALASYLGLDALQLLRDREQTAANLTTPYDDGIPDLPPGIVDVGHLHQPNGPWVVWNTGGDTVTWTLVDQLGTAGGVENAPTFSRFSTPLSAPLKPIMVRLQYVDVDSGLPTGYVTVECALDARCTISDRVDVGLPGGKPGAATGTPAPTG
ncbi:MAG: hypothetical protein QOF00_1777 [Pseudonocardiales bacterium]|nr:hypothetical protein [Pseudonocardiales bacterium]